MEVKYKIAKVHRIITRELGRPELCEHCGEKKERLAWSNKDHKYSLDLEQWQRLCPSCHKKYDMEFNSVDKVCVSCGKKFTTQRLKTMTCSPNCAKVYKRHKYKENYLDIPNYRESLVNF